MNTKFQIISQTKKEDRLRNNREAARRYRARLRENTKLFEDYKQKARNRYHNNKKELSTRDQRRKKRYERERKRLYRARQKDQLNQGEINVPSTSYDPDVPERTHHQASLQSVRGKRISAKRQRKCYHDNFKLKDQNKKLQTQLNTARKRISRLRIKNSKASQKPHDIEASADQLLLESNKNRETI